MQVSRLFQIVYLLLEHKTMTAHELSEHFEVSTRTIYRDVDTLAQAGIPIYAIRGGGGGIRLTENFVLNKSVLSDKEQENILSSLRGMGALNVVDVAPVLSKLAGMFGTETVDWIEVDFSSWNPANPVSQRFEVLKGAIFARRSVTFRYSAMGGNTQPRTVEPMKLVFRGYDWYLLAWCRARKDFRFFKLMRMDELAVEEEQFERKVLLPYKPEQQEFTVKQVDVTVRIAPELAYHVYDDFLPSQRELQEDGSFIVRFSMPENEWLYGYLMTFGAGLQVLEPEHVRTGLVRRLQETLNNY